MNIEEKKKHFATKCFSVLERVPFKLFKHTTDFFHKMFLIFYIHEKCMYTKSRFLSQKYAHNKKIEFFECFKL